jgi:hypothetical protein
VIADDSGAPAAPDPSRSGAPLRRFLFAVSVLTLLCLFCAPLYMDDIAASAPPRDGVAVFPRCRWRESGASCGARRRSLGDQRPVTSPGSGRLANGVAPPSPAGLARGCPGWDT